MVWKNGWLSMLDIFYVVYFRRDVLTSMRHYVSVGSAPVILVNGTDFALRVGDVTQRCRAFPDLPVSGKFTQC